MRKNVRFWGELFSPFTVRSVYGYYEKFWKKEAHLCDEHREI